MDLWGQGRRRHRLGASSRIWFTLLNGIVTEIYAPTIDRPQVRDLQYLVTDGSTFCHEERRDLQSTTEGTPALDASALMMPIVGFLPASDVRMTSTINVIPERLNSHGLVYRYLADDGLPGGEATFALCTFWMIDGLALSGRLAEAMFARVTRLANDVGLLSEEIELTTGRFLGNFPQAFTHLALIRSASRLATARQGHTIERSQSP